MEADEENRKGWLVSAMAGLAFCSFTLPLGQPFNSTHHFHSQLCTLILWSLHSYTALSQMDVSHPCTRRSASCLALTSMPVPRRSCSCPFLRLMLSTECPHHSQQASPGPSHHLVLLKAHTHVSLQDVKNIRVTCGQVTAATTWGGSMSAPSSPF